MVRLAGRRMCVEGCVFAIRGWGKQAGSQGFEVEGWSERLVGLFLPGLLGVCVPVFWVFVMCLVVGCVFSLFRWVRE